MSNVSKIDQPFSIRLKSPTQARRALPLKPISAAGITESIHTTLNQPAQNPDRLLYIHIPFCSKTCSFCIYNRNASTPAHTIKLYVDTIIDHIYSVGKTPWVQSAPFKAVYFGGGTPTAIPAQDLVSIIKAVKETIPLTNDCEISVESTISAVNPQLLSSITKAGVNRISLGVQTFDNGIRRNLGRESDNETIARKIGLISQSGISNICIDLIYGLPNQTLESWNSDLAMLQQLPITGCSVYPLVSKPNGNEDSTEFDIDLEYNFFAAAHNILNKIEGWQQFTPVQYGHSVNGKAIYVSGHGQSADLLALGAGAGGRINSYTYLANPNIDEFLAYKGNFNQTPKVMLSIDKEFLNLRKVFNLSEGLSLNNQHNQDLKMLFNNEFDFLNKNGLATEIGATVQLTQKGCFWAANISELFAKRIGVLLQGNEPRA